MAKEPMVEEEVVEPPAVAEGPGDEAEAVTPVEEDKGEVLLTVCKEPDGTYRLIIGDEEDAEEIAPGEDAAEANAVGATDAGPGKVYDSPGALLKAILDVLNAGEESAGEPGTADEQFEAGFGGTDVAAPAPAAPGGMPQKY